MNNELSLINQNDLQAARNELTAIGNLTAQKEAKAIEVAMVTAKRFPRDITVVEDKIAKTCGRRRLAETAEYSYPRDKKTISGASIKLLEAVAQCYGNLEFGVSELQRNGDNSDCQAYAWDFENNIKTTREFNVPHYRDKKEGSRESKRLTEDRDIREMIFNYGSRNVRACLERVIPRDLVESAMEICRKTLNNDTRSLADRIADCKAMYKDTFEISGEFLEKLVGEKSSNWTKSHISQLAKYFSALKEGEITVKDLEANFTATVSGAQIKELAGIIGTDEKKMAALEALGYKMSEIKKIPLAEYENIKTALTVNKETGEVQA